MKNIAAGDVERYKKRSMQRNRNEVQIAGENKRVEKSKKNSK